MDVEYSFTTKALKITGGAKPRPDCGQYLRYTPAIRRFLQKTLPIAASFCSNLLDKAAGLTKKQRIAAKGLASLLGIAALFSSCPGPTDDNKKPDPKCECPVKIHDGYCGATCFGKGNAGCVCVDKTHSLVEGATLADERTNVAEADQNAVLNKVGDFNQYLTAMKDPAASNGVSSFYKKIAFF